MRNAIGVFQLIYQNRHILKNLIFWELKRKYTGSRLGFFWVFFQHLILVVIYTFVFSLVFGVKLPGFERSGGFVFYLLSGLLPWLAFQESVLRSSRSLQEHAGIIKNMVFPMEIIQVYQASVAMINMLIGFAILLPLLAAMGYPVGMSLLLLPAVFALQLLFAVGLGWILASLNLVYKDVEHIAEPTLLIWFWLCPIVYTVEMIKYKPAQWIVLLNPMTHFMSIYHKLILQNSLPGITEVVIVFFFSFAAFYLGRRIFKKYQPIAADMV